MQSPNYTNSNNCQGPQLSEAVRKFMTENGSNGKQNPCPPEFSSERCDAARKVMDTYAVDFEWSEAQQIAGLKFAEQNCPPYDPEKSPEKVAFKIQQEKYSSAPVESNLPQTDSPATGIH